MNKIYRKNDCVRVSIVDMGIEGEGIGKADGFTLFVKDAVPGDIVEAKIVKSKKNYAYARLEKVITPSPFRVEPKCIYHRQCGGCQLQVLSYEKQLEYKQQKIRNNLIRIGGFPPEYIDSKMDPIIGMENPYYYRNKAQYPVGTDRNGNIITGFYAGRTHTIIANTECHLGALENQEILEVILEHMRRFGIPAYEESTGKGLIRHVLIRKGFVSGEIMVCLVINKDVETTQKTVEKGNGTYSGDFTTEDSPVGMEIIPEQSILLEKLTAIKGMKSISVSINAERTNVIMGKEIIHLWGSPVISDTIHVRDMQREGYPFTGHELTFHISPLSFYQVNPVQTEKLYSLALEYAGLTGREIVWDLYCGIGTISLFLAGSARKVYGVEVIPQAIEDARENAKRNGIRNVEFYVGRAEEILPEFYGRDTRAEEYGVKEADNKVPHNENMGRNKAEDKETHNENVGRNKAEVKEAFIENVKKRKTEDKLAVYGIGETKEKDSEMLHPDVIVVDPPRKGCNEACLDIMLKMKPSRIVYVSCDSATLARDLKVLCDGGYEIRKIRGVDQFGMTVHVETCVLLSRKKSSGKSTKIEIEIDLNEADRRECIGTATYQEIKDYVWEHYQTKVSHLYIAQIKKKCGLDVGENFNKPKTEGNKVPNCPEEKERMIREALEYFGMINKE